MLVTTRKPGERLLIGDDIVITVASAGRGQVRLGIDAPKSVKICRVEYLPADHPARQVAGGQMPAKAG